MVGETLPVTVKEHEASVILAQDGRLTAWCDMQTHEIPRRRIA